MLTPTASNRISTSKGMLQTLIVSLIAKSDDKFVTHDMKWGNTDLISTRFKFIKYKKETCFGNLKWITFSVECRWDYEQV